LIAHGGNGRVQSGIFDEVHFMTDEKTGKRRLRSEDWFDNREHVDMAALYLERFMNYGITPEELRSGAAAI
jgi:xylonate dehydratase